MYKNLWRELQISDITRFPMNEGSLHGDIPDLKVQVRRWVKGRVHLARRNVQWIQWVWRRLLEPLHWDTRAGTPRSGLDMQRGRCVQTSNAHSYCVVTRCTEHHTWYKGNKDQLIVDKREINCSRTQASMCLINTETTCLPITSRATDNFLGVESSTEEKFCRELYANHSHFFCFRQKMVLT